MVPPVCGKAGAGGGAGAHRAVEVDVDDVGEDLGVELGAAADDAGAVDQDVEPRRGRRRAP